MYQQPKRLRLDQYFDKKAAETEYFDSKTDFELILSNVVEGRPNILPKQVREAGHRLSLAVTRMQELGCKILRDDK